MKFILLLAFALSLFVAGCVESPSSITDSPGDAPSLVKFTALTPGLEVIRRVGPDYPAELYAAGVTGQVKVFLDLNSAGEVAVARVTESSEPRFEVPTIKGILKWKFKPGPREGEILFRFENPNSPTTTSHAIQADSAGGERH